MIIKAVILISGIILIWLLSEGFFIEIKEDIIKSEDIPKKFDNLKIVFISDIHYSYLYPKWRVKNMVKKVNKIYPDILILGGDYINKDRDKIPIVFDMLNEINVKYKKYGVLGNHDNKVDKELTLKCMENNGIINLDNKSYWFFIDNEKIKIGGVGDLLTDTQNIDNTLFDVSENDFIIMVSHNPLFSKQLINKKVDLVLSGHTHGGQVTFFGKWAPEVGAHIEKGFMKGTVTVDNTKVIISNGIGFSAYVPFRFFARPQINIITLKSEKK